MILITSYENDTIVTCVIKEKTKIQRVKSLSHGQMIRIGQNKDLNPLLLFQSLNS